MLIQRKTDYALRILRALKDGKMHSITDISEEEVIPQKFAYKIVGDLRKANILSATRGANGGCQLIKDLDTLSLYDVVTVVDGPKYINKCAEPGYACEWCRMKNDDCPIREHLLELQDYINEEMKTHSLAEMIG